MAADARRVPALARGRPDDLASVMALLRGVVAGLRALGIDQWDDIYPVEADIARDLAAGNAWLAREGDALLGYAVLDANEPPEYATGDWRGRDALVAHRVMVDPARRGRGVGRGLMAGVEAIARADGRDSLRLDAFTGNAPSLAFYRACGYREAGGIRFRKGAFALFEKLLAPAAGT